LSIGEPVMESSYFVTINKQAEEEIKAVPHLQNSIYHDLDIAATLDFFARRYVIPLMELFDIDQSTVVDSGTGYGWFSFAYLLLGGKAAIAADLDSDRLAAAKEIAAILSLTDRTDFINSPIQDTPLSENSVELFVSIETLEHVGQSNIRPALERIKGIASHGILITTPNKLFPVIAHDTRLPAAHWFPEGWRQRYAEALNRGHMNANNDFVSPFDLQVLKDKFIPATSCLVFQDFEGYRNHYPFYLPYDIQGRWQKEAVGPKVKYFQFASSLFGRNSYWVMPSLARIFVRKNN